MCTGSKETGVKGSVTQQREGSQRNERGARSSWEEDE